MSSYIASCAVGAARRRRRRRHSLGAAAHYRVRRSSGARAPPGARARIGSAVERPRCEGGRRSVHPPWRSLARSLAHSLQVLGGALRRALAARAAAALDPRRRHQLLPDARGADPAAALARHADRVRAHRGVPERAAAAAVGRGHARDRTRLARRHLRAHSPMDRRVAYSRNPNSDRALRVGSDPSDRRARRPSPTDGRDGRDGRNDASC